MKIILNEKSFSSFLGNLINESNINPISQKINIATDLLERMISHNGLLMLNIENGKEYLVLEDVTLTNLIGKRCCICRLMKEGKAFGPIYVKPLDLFKMKNY